MTSWSIMPNATHALTTAMIAVLAGWLCYALLFALLKRIAKASTAKADEDLVDELLTDKVRWPISLLFVAMALSIAQQINSELARIWGEVARFVIPALVGWTAHVMVRFSASWLERSVDTSQNVQAARSRRTRIALFARTASFLIGFVTLALMLFAIPAVQNIGVTLMASAGLATLAVGAAAQPVLKSLVAGIQIAITEPLRLGDTIMIDGQVGKVEDMRLSYVVIRQADERRVIVPTAKFLDNSFQNWTRMGNAINGAIIIPIRPGLPLPLIREAYNNLLAAQPLWDKRTSAMQVSDVNVGAIELKFIMSAKDPAELNQLRTQMREAMLEWLRTDLPEALCTKE